MYKISEIIAIPVLSLFECEYQGIIYNALFDRKQKKCKYFCVLNEDDNIQKSLKSTDIYKIGKDCMFIKNNGILELECSNDRIIDNHISLLNLQVFNLNGENLGICKDIELDNNFNIISIILNNNLVIDNQKIVNIGNTIILINDNPINFNKFKPRLKSYITNPPFKNKIILLNKNTNANTDKINFSQSNNKIITNQNFLLGRIITQDIKAINGEIIAKKNAVINKEIIHKASSYGKIIEIARLSTKK